VRAENLPLSSSVIDRALACLDQVSDWTEAFAAEGVLPPRAGEVAAAMKTSLRALLTGETGVEASKELRQPADQAKAAVPDWVCNLIGGAGDRVAAAKRDEIVAIAYEPRSDCFFNGDDPLQTMRKIPNVLALRIEAAKPWPPLAEFDPYVCHVRFQ